VQRCSKPSIRIWSSAAIVTVCGTKSEIFVVEFVFFAFGTASGYYNWDREKFGRQRYTVSVVSGWGTWLELRLSGRICFSDGCEVRFEGRLCEFALGRAHSFKTEERKVTETFATRRATTSKTRNQSAPIITAATTVALFL